jgi:YihY family inner membrane protein
MSLVYTTLLSLVPLLAFSFSVLKGFGVHRQVEPLLYEFLQPLGPKGAEITDQIIGFVENVKGGVLGGVGLALLVFTVISMIQKIEDTFNYIWQVQKARSIARRFSDYLSVILVGPVLMVTAMGLLASITSSAAMQRIAEIEPFGSLAGHHMRQPRALQPGGAAVHLHLRLRAEYARRLGAALTGGVLAGAGWTTGGSLFATFVVTSTRYAAIYSSFAIAIVALIWLYLSWLILLIGAQIAFYVQYPAPARRPQSQLKLSIAQVERLALASCTRSRAVSAAARSRASPAGPRAGSAGARARGHHRGAGTGLLLAHRKGQASCRAAIPDTIPGGQCSPRCAARAGAVATRRSRRCSRRSAPPEADRLAGRSLADLAGGTAVPRQTRTRRGAGPPAASVACDGHPPISSEPVWMTPRRSTSRPPPGCRDRAPSGCRRS